MWRRTGVLHRVPGLCAAPPARNGTMYQDCSGCHSQDGAPPDVQRILVDSPLHFFHRLAPAGRARVGTGKRRPNGNRHDTELPLMAFLEVFGGGCSSRSQGRQPTPPRHRVWVAFGKDPAPEQAAPRFGMRFIGHLGQRGAASVHRPRGSRRPSSAWGAAFLGVLSRSPGRLSFPRPDDSRGRGRERWRWCRPPQ